MDVLLNPALSGSADDKPVQSSSSSAPHAPTQTKTPAPEKSGEPQSVAPIANNVQANVTFRRDAQGQIYYVVSDAKSGKEILELPPAVIRKVAEGIGEFLKQQEAKHNPRVDVKA